ncbi:MAG: leucine--tRNA ligase [Chlorobi bacterium]|nr:leucine--tRNA ligase [Chlorobiota bacterium]MCI0714772.1 leucine--tRNA ligase [Chlorobiota bacterium]
MKYNFTEIENKWQKYWEENRTFGAKEDYSKPKYYVLDFFPYPSSEGLHVGHPEGYIATDIIARYKRMNGFNVLHPMGWDAFGLPAEQYAIKTGIHPRMTTQKSIDNFKRQLKAIGFSYDWDREIATIDPKYYKWTQWIFIQLYKKGLAYQAEVPVNWCPELGTVLANEEVPEQIEKGYTIERRPMKQWMLKITQYAERLLVDLDMLDWPESTKEMQRNWIGKSEGAKVNFKIKSHPETIEIFTTRPDTLWGATYMVLSPEHPYVEIITTPECRTALEIYVNNAKNKSDLERQALEKEKTGVFTGAYAINPVNNDEIPIWISDYVLMSYGTGAIMAVPGHDQRDWEFANKFHLPIVEVVKLIDSDKSDLNESVFTGEGVSVNSGFITGLKTEKAKKKVIEWLEQKSIGKRAVQYKLRDWLFSRQRFWGEPFPIIYLEDGTVKLVPEEDLPVTLPEVDNYKTSGTGESPLAGFPDWVNTVDKETGMPAKRETNTMPQWAGSCWYYLRFLDPRNDKEIVNKEKEKYWMPVNLYLGGAEHAVLHLLYARFWHKVLFDLGYVSTREPFVRLYHQGMILGNDSNKMSKSRGNVVNPDDVIAKYGSDSLRLFEMFLGPLSATKPWSTKGIEGVYRFLNKAWRLVIDESGSISSKIKESSTEGDAERLMHRTIKNITDDIDDMDMKFNTCVSELMIFVNEMSKMEVIPKTLVVTLVKLMAPFAPHMAEELWQRLGNESTIAYEKWPEYDPAKAQKSMVTVVGQINGKVRARIEVESGTDEEKLKELIKHDEKIKSYIDGKQIVKEIVVKNKLVNIVVK